MYAKNLSLSFGTSVIYDNANFNLLARDKVGIVGVNGAGKTTLFRILTGNIQPDSGVIDFGGKTVSYLPQQIKFETGDITVWDFLLSGRPINELQNKLQQLYIKIADNPDDVDIANMISETQERLEYYNCYSAEDELLEIISNMDIDSNMLDMQLCNLSGGQKSKVAFARLLYSMAGILLLDELTNHLDVKTKQWVTEYLQKYKGCVLIISHDTDFLNQIVNKILLVDKISHKTIVYDGDYNSYLNKAKTQKHAREVQILAQERQIKKLSDFVARANAASPTNHSIKRMGLIRTAVLEKITSKRIERDRIYKKVKMDLSPLTVGAKYPISVDDLWFRFPEQRLLYRKLSFCITGGERFLIVGENGVGKTTLLKLIMGLHTPDRGMIKINPKTDIAYYAQELELLDKSKSVLENVTSDDYTELQLRAGYTFAGFYDANGTQYYTADGASAHEWDKIDTEPVLYAHWTECGSGNYCNGSAFNATQKCNTNYPSTDTNTASAASDCYTTCSAGTRVASANNACTTPSGNWYTLKAHKVYYGSTSKSETDYTTCPSEYSINGTKAADHDAKSDCQITCSAGTQVATKDKTCTTPQGNNWYTGSHTVAAGNISDTNVKNCVTGYTTNNTALSTDHDEESDCQITCSAGQYIATANKTCETCPAGYYCEGITITQGNKGGETQCPVDYRDGDAGISSQNMCRRICEQVKIDTCIGYDPAGEAYYDNECNYTYRNDKGMPSIIDENGKCVATTCLSDHEMRNGACEPCNRPHALSYKNVGNCMVAECEEGYHPSGQSCLPNTIECMIPNATSSTRVYNAKLNDYSECRVDSCEYGYHVVANACVSNTRLCSVDNGYGSQEWNTKTNDWDECIADRCEPGYTSDPMQSNEPNKQCGVCSNKYGIKGERAVSSYTTECEIASCMYQGELYKLEGNECIPICEMDGYSDETGTRKWNPQTGKCVRKCNPGYTAW